MTLALALLAAWLSAAPAPPSPPPEPGQAGKDVIWIPTPEAVLERMLMLAQVGPDDLVVDLGAGDGRLVIRAAREYGARGLGIEYSANLVALARREAARAGVAARVRMVRADLFAADYREASVVGLYLMPELLARLRPALLKLRPGTRIVSHQFAIADWEPDDLSWVGDRAVYLWIVPAEVAGAWRLTTSDGLGADLGIEQRCQRISGRARLASVMTSLREPSLRGDALRFSLVDEAGTLREFEGRLREGRLSGSFRAGATQGTWEASRPGEAARGGAR